MLAGAFFYGYHTIFKVIVYIAPKIVEQFACLFITHRFKQVELVLKMFKQQTNRMNNLKLI